MNVDGLKPPGKAQPGEQVQQDNGVATTGQPHGKAFIRGKTGRQELADPCAKIS